LRRKKKEEKKKEEKKNKEKKGKERKKKKVSRHFQRIQDRFRQTLPEIKIEAPFRIKNLSFLFFLI